MSKINWYSSTNAWVPSLEFRAVGIEKSCDVDEASEEIVDPSSFMETVSEVVKL